MFVQCRSAAGRSPRCRRACTSTVSPSAKRESRTINFSCGGRMARRLSSRLSVAAVLGAAFIVTQSLGCGGSDTTPGGGGGDDTGINPDGISGDADTSPGEGGDD